MPKKAPKKSGKLRGILIITVLLLLALLTVALLLRFSQPV